MDNSVDTVCVAPRYLRSLTIKKLMLISKSESTRQTTRATAITKSSQATLHTDSLTESDREPGLERGHRPPLLPSVNRPHRAEREMNRDDWILFFSTKPFILNWSAAWVLVISPPTYSHQTGQRPGLVHTIVHVTRLYLWPSGQVLAHTHMDTQLFLAVSVCGWS